MRLGARAEQSRRIALISSDIVTRNALAGYLTNAGFEVCECVELNMPTSFGAIVVLGDHSSVEALVADVRSWLRIAKTQRLIVVTAKPSALKELVITHAPRLVVLAAPAFGWDLADALRASSVDGPRGA